MGMHFVHSLYIFSPQVGHASIGLYRELCENQTRHGAALLQWEQFGWVLILLHSLGVFLLHSLDAFGKLLKSHLFDLAFLILLRVEQLRWVLILLRVEQIVIVLILLHS